MKSETEPLSLGIDLGGSKILAGVVNSRGKILSHHQIATPAKQGPDAVIQSLFEAAYRALERAGIAATQLKAIGIGAAGALNLETGIVSSSPNLPGWEDVPLRDIVEREFRVKTVLGNDANAAALGELYFGAGKGTRNLIYVTVSTGIGGGIIIDGKLYTGASGAAGEIGHMTIDTHGPRCNCGNIGCWEVLASGTALAKEARRRLNEGAKSSLLDHAMGDVERVTAQTVHAAAQQGDLLAKELIDRTGYFVGVGLVNLTNIFNPELIVIGGGLANMGDMLLKPAIKVVKERAFRISYQTVRFTLAQLGRDSGIMGAAALALHETKEPG